MLKQGIYEHLISQRTKHEMEEAEAQSQVCVCDEIDCAESSKMLADYLAKTIQQRLEDAETTQDRVQLINHLLNDFGLAADEQIVNHDQLLVEVMSQQRSQMQRAAGTSTLRPESGFRVSNLFTGGNSSLSLIEEIRRDIASSDEIYLIVSFLKLSGVRLLLDDLRTFCQREGTRLHVITTTYCGVTEAKALQQLAALPHTEIRISYQTQVERLHAKAYIFVRHSGMSTAYIGSSNLSKSAQTDGLEWNMRVTSVENPHIIKTALATFDLYWNSPNFEDFALGGIEKFQQELKLNQTRSAAQGSAALQHFTLLPHQKTILDKLEVERTAHHNYRNLIVAATGTGKTVISAFDYVNFLRQRKAAGQRARILFTAHREEILRQSLYTYRSVLGDANFGTLWVGQSQPHCEEDFEALFVSITMLNSRYDTFFAQLPADYYDYIVIDEAHHSQADSYRKLFDHFRPQLLVGLTATPERMDGRDLRPDFGGRISAEIRLPQALQAGLLTPFHYYCITDTTDLSDDSLWKGGKYDTERLSERLCNPMRMQLIVRSLEDNLANDRTCRALCFCVNKRHAAFTAKCLRQCGYSAASLTSDESPEERKQCAEALRNGELHYLCVVDIFNEGVDIPEVDTVLFLRPTESLTIFLQQLGRGLRLAPGKSELTVLDYVGQANKKYDFANKFRALSLRPEKNLVKQIKNGFTFLPYGCNIIMERKARKYILDNIQQAIYNKTRLIKEINAYTGALPTISQFLENNGQDIRILYTSKHCWTWLKREAGRLDYPRDKVTDVLERGMGNLIHYNSVTFLHFVQQFLQQGAAAVVDERTSSFATMLYYALFGLSLHRLPFACSSVIAALQLLHAETYRPFKEEMQQIVDYLLEHISITTQELGDELFPGVELYGCYTRSDIFTLVGQQTADKTMQGSVSGVFQLKGDRPATLLFVTLNKSDKDFSPSTQYDDYVINQDFFHWQSKNTDRHNNSGGRIYTQQPEKQNRIILFVREEKRDAFGNTCPFFCFGPVDYVKSIGDAPMNITWRMHHPIMPAFCKVV